MPNPERPVAASGGTDVEARMKKIKDVAEDANNRHANPTWKYVVELVNELVRSLQAMTDPRLTEAQVAEIEAQYQSLKEEAEGDTDADYALTIVQRDLQFDSILADRRVLVEALRKAEAVGRIWKRRALPPDGEIRGNTNDLEPMRGGWADPREDEIDAEVRRDA
jgi:Fe2+ transport system protein B